METPWVSGKSRCCYSKQPLQFTRTRKPKPRQPSPRIIRILLDWGVRNNITQDDLGSLKKVMYFRACDNSQELFMSEEMLDLWGHRLQEVIIWSGKLPSREQFK